MSILPDTSSDHDQAGQSGPQDEALRPMQGTAQSPAPEAQRGVSGQEAIEVEIPRVIGITSSTWGLRAYVWEKLVEAGVPLKATADLYSDPVPTRGTLTWWHSPTMDAKVFRWTP